MNRLCLAAGLIMATITVLHTVGGGTDVHQPLLAQVDTAEMQLYVSVLWHFATFALVTMTATLLWAAFDFPARQATAVLCAVLTTGVALLFFGYGITRLGTIWTAPQWLLFLPAIILIAAATIRQNAR
ncbi:MAG: hypothetical protein JKY00_05690 [Roseicyclus sp.]|nr:hypothetical protein [Roseicyclus sp.]